MSTTLRHGILDYYNPPVGPSYYWPTDGLVGAWRFNSDSSFGPVAGTNTYYWTPVTGGFDVSIGKQAECVINTGTSARLDLNAAAFPGFDASSWSFSAWFWMTSAGGEWTLPILAKGNTWSAGQSVALGWAIYSSGGYIRYDKFTTTNLDTPKMWNRDAWNHYVVTRDAGTKAVQMFVNGSLRQSTANDGATPNTTTNPFHIFVCNGIGQTVSKANNRIDEMIFYNRVLSNADVSTLWTGIA